jgi:hypothetical protein
VTLEEARSRALRRDPHFEDVLYTIFGLAAAYPAGAYTSALGALIKAKSLPQKGIALGVVA